VSDLPLLDAARRRLGDPEASRRKRRHDAAVAAEREQMARVIDNLIEAADDEYGVGLVTMLRGEDFQDALVHGSAWDLGPVLDTWLAAHADGIACVIGDPTFRATSRVRSLTPELSKGLEFDLVVLIDPEAFGKGIEGAVDRYVAMTRATQRLVILTSS